MSASNKLLQAAAGVGGEGGDADFESTVLLLNADDASNGGQNNTFLDSSSNAHTITRNGNVTQGSFSPFSVDDGKWGVYFDGTASGVSIPTDSELDWGTSTDFTMECWFYSDVVITSNTAIMTNRSTSAAPAGFLIGVNTTNDYVQVYFGATLIITSSTSISASQWYHIALTRNGGTIELFIDGVSEGTDTTSRNVQNTDGVKIGGTIAGPTSFGTPTGYISNARIISGTALYTSAFTPPTAPLTDVAGTSLLTCQSNRFVDNSGNDHSITVSGNPKVVPFSPFPQTTAYDASTNGGSGYFDGAGDYLGCNEALDGLTSASDPFTAECWFYCTEIPASSFITMIGINSPTGATNEMVLSVNNTNEIAIHYAGEARQEVGTVNANTWHHVAGVFDGTDFKVYLDGGLIYTRSSKTPTGPLSSDVLHIGSEIDSGTSFGNYFKGYISNVRITESAVYNSAFTPPTTPLTDITNTSLLTNFTNASIVDATGKNVLETVGNAQVDTTTVKYGTGAMEFDGTGDWLELNTKKDLFSFGTGDYTIELWSYARSASSGDILGTRTTSTNGWFLFYFGGELRWVETNNTATVFTSSSNAPANTWNHIAVTRENGTVRLFTNGVLRDSASSSASVDSPTGLVRIGYKTFESSSVVPFDGYMDDLRITKGIARYTANFTPPEAELPVIGE